MQAWVSHAQTEPDRGVGGVGLPFAIVDLASGQVAGSTSLYEIQLPHRRAELGRTWLGIAYQRTGLNTESKLLLLTYAFETLRLRRVQLKASIRNERSLRAIERLGAHFEGVLRQFATLGDRTAADVALYSFVAQEWESAKQRILGLLR